MQSALVWEAGPADGKTSTLCRIQLQQGVIFMVGQYEVRLGPDAVGMATVEKQGLYYLFSCRCRLSGATMHRVMVACGGKQVDLGICVPMGHSFGLEKKVPCKYLGEGEPEFFLTPRPQSGGGKFVPVYPEEPFAYMSRLKDAYLEIRNGQTGIMIRE